MNKKNSKKGLSIVLLLLLVVVVAFGARTFAKYISTINGTDSSTVNVAKWEFENDNASKTFTFDLANTYDPGTLVANKIAPGTRGSLPISLSNEHSEVGVDYEIVLTVNAGGSLPTNLKFYKGDSEISLVNGEYTITGKLTPGQKVDDLGITWEWAYETENGDVDDTNDGKNVSDSNITISATITGTQTTPEVN